ncbi:MAG: hypothetical protein AB8H79_07970, partial [Myxococcota bacterium]
PSHDSRHHGPSVVSNGSMERTVNRLLLAVLLTSCTHSESIAAEPTPYAVATPQSKIRRASDPDEGLAIGTFQALTAGIEIGIFTSDAPHILGDGRVRVVRVDPAVADVVVHSIVGTAIRPQGADSWAATRGLTVAFNPAMYHPDGKSVFYLKTPERESQPVWKASSSSALVIDPKGVKLLDVTCDGRARLNTATTIVQSWRLLDCARKPTWKEKPKIWSHALLGADSQGRLLFIHARTPWSTRAFTEIVLALPLDVQRLHYAEGGPEASLVVVHDGVERVWVGSYETGFTEHDNNRLAWNLPHILGVVARQP